MVNIRAELWCAAFVRRHNDLGNICVVSRRGDAIAGQVWIEIDHLNGQFSLFCQAPGFMQTSKENAWLFQCIFDRKDTKEVQQRIAREANFDPDFWLLTLESRADRHETDGHGSDHGLDIVAPDA